MVLTLCHSEGCDGRGVGESGSESIRRFSPFEASPQQFNVLEDSVVHGLD